MKQLLVALFLLIAVPAVPAEASVVAREGEQIDAYISADEDPNAGVMGVVFGVGGLERLLELKMSTRTRPLSALEQYFGSQKVRQTGWKDFQRVLDRAQRVAIGGEATLRRTDSPFGVYLPLQANPPPFRA